MTPTILGTIAFLFVSLAVVVSVSIYDARKASAEMRALYALFRAALYGSETEREMIRQLMREDSPSYRDMAQKLIAGKVALVALQSKGERHDKTV